MMKSVTRPSMAAFCLVFTAVFGLLGCEPAAVAENGESTQAQSGDTLNLQSDIEKASYLFGYMQVEQIQNQTNGVMDLELFVAGLKDAIAGIESQVDPAEGGNLNTALQAAIMEQRNAASADVIAAGDAYRAEYAAKEGVTTLPSGLAYEVIKEGTGAKPQASDTVTTHYHGMLTDGTVFDSSVDRGQPASFPVGGVIAGWTEALQLMGVGSKWRLVIPPDLAYGERGAGGSIPPHATLIFEVELLEIN